MARRTRILAGAAALCAAAALGGGAAIGVAASLGDLGTTTTVREFQPPVAAAAATAPARNTLSINEIYTRAAPGVVQVTSTWQTKALGSGFVIDKAGHLVTNYHVVQDAKRISVSFSNGGTMKATMVGYDPSSDLAVLKVDANSRALTPLPLGDSDATRVGDSVVAIGNPFGLDRTVTAGIVSAIQRAITVPSGYTIEHVIQTDATIGRGNSGGPLLNGRSEVIGVNSQIGFAVPSNTVKTVIAQLIREGRVDRAFIGISATPITRSLAGVFRLPVARGLLVERVEPGSGAAKSGLKAGTTQVVLAGETYELGGDIIVQAGGSAVASLNRLRDIVATKKPGDRLALIVYRGNKRQSLGLILGRQREAAR